MSTEVEQAGRPCGIFAKKNAASVNETIRTVIEVKSGSRGRRCLQFGQFTGFGSTEFSCPGLECSA